MFNYTLHEPLGVCVAITAWNSPLMLTTWKLAPALAAGNTVIVKPSEFASTSALEFVKLFEEANIIARHDFGDGRSRYEEAGDEHHDHLIDVQTGEVLEFVNEQIEKLQRDVADKLGYKLVGHRLELYGKKMKPEADKDKKANG